MYPVNSDQSACQKCGNNLSKFVVCQNCGRNNSEMDLNSILSNKPRATQDDKEEVFVINDFWSPREVAKYIVHNIKDSIDDNRTFTILNIKDIVDQVSKWHKWMPRVKPFYAVKCSSSNIVLEVLASLGVNFDCASLNELKQVLSIGVQPHRIIFAHTAKTPSSLKYAKSENVDLLTFDSDIELVKIKQIHPTARLLIRIRSDAQDAVCLLGNKFGCCPVTEAPILLKVARDLQLNVVGICFHVGSLCNEFEAYVNGIRMARDLFELGSNLGFDMKILDIGGGFPGDSDAKMDVMCEKINSTLDKYFPSDGSVEIIAEPGRFFVLSAFTLACLVHSAKRPMSKVTGMTDYNVSTPTSKVTSQIPDNSGNSMDCKSGNKQINGKDHMEVKQNANNNNGNVKEEILVGCDEIYDFINDFSNTTNDQQSAYNIMYYMDNGIYASFAGVLWKRLVMRPEPLEPLPGPNVECSLWGPTCDGKDMILSRVFLPPLPIPSWLIFPHFGAYTCTTSTSFNGFTKPLQFTYIQRKFLNSVKDLPHMAARNNIKWIEMTQNMPRTTTDGSEIPTHLPFKQLHSYMNEIYQNGDEFEDMDCQPSANGKHKMSECPNKATHDTRVIHISNSFLTSNALTQGMQSETDSSDNTVESDSSDQETCQPSSFIMATVRNVNDFFSKNECDQQPVH